MIEENLTVAQASHELGVSRLTIRNHIKAGRIIATLPLGIKQLGWKINRESFDRFKREYRGE